VGRRSKEPWYRSGRDAWYVEVNGSQVLLAKGKANEKAAWKEFRRVMARKELPAPDEPAAPPVGRLVAEYLKHLTRRREADEIEPSSKRDAVRRLADFPEKCGHLGADKIRPHHVLDWLETRRYVPKHAKDAPPPETRPIGPTTRHDSIGVVKAVFAWAERAGHIERDPLKGLEKPERNKRRERVITGGQWPAVRAAILSERFRDLADFLYESGARPGEAFRLEAKHVDLANGVAVLTAREHKSGRKTGKTRPVYLSARAREIVTRLMAERPAGPIFRNARGNPWNKDNVNCQVCRIRARSGVGNEFVAYALRHLFATDALDRKIPVATVAGMLGHSDPRMVATVYSRLDERHDHFTAAVKAVRDAEPEG
jgi:integrase